jgi:hypothetical protein
MATTVGEFEQLARDFVNAFGARDESALERLNQHYRRTFAFDDLAAEIWRRVYAHRQRTSRGETPHLRLDEAHILIAQDLGYPSWAALTHGVTSGTPGVPAYAIDLSQHAISPRRHLSDQDWDALIGALEDERITVVESSGLMTDGALARIATLPHVTTLRLEGSRQITERGLRHLTAMPQLQHLSLSGVKLTDQSLEVLRELPNLRSFALNWQRGITDAGMAHLKHCDQLERVDLMGSPVGDGAIRALEGKPGLQEFKSGRQVTDEGLRLLHNFPRLKTGDAGRLLIDGPFTNEGLAALVGLDGVAELDLFWHCTRITSAGFAHLASLPNLTALGADGALSDDISMQHMATLPRLRKLRAQEAAASDAGFEALSRSRTLEGLWGRECAGFGNRGFRALSKMLSLKELGIGCRNVEDDALAAFPDFPALQSLTPIGVTDSGFRHIGRCPQLERLTCMYCRTTTDAATEQIVNLPLRYYYAGLTQITDRSLETLGRITTLEQVEFYETTGISDAGLPFLAGLPRLREIAIDSAPNVTLGGTRVFPPHIRVRYST